MTKRSQFVCGLALVSVAVVVQVLVESNVTSSSLSLNMFVLHAMVFVWLSFAAIIVGSIFLASALTSGWRKSVKSKVFAGGVVLLGAAILSALLLFISIVFNLSGVNLTF